MCRTGHLGLAVASAPLYQRFYSYYDYPNSLTHIVLILSLAILGGKFPDLDMKLIPRGTPKEIAMGIHRQTMHSLIILVISIFYVYNFLVPNDYRYEYIMYFLTGVASHLLGDILTGTIPLLVWGSYRRGGKLRIGIKNNIIKGMFVKLGKKIAPFLIIFGIYELISYNLQYLELKPIFTAMEKFNV